MEDNFQEFLICLLFLLESIGLKLDIINNNLDIRVPSGKLSIDVKRFHNALEAFNKKLPGGSLKEYIYLLLNNLNSNVIKSALKRIETIIIVLFVTIFVLCSVMIIILVTAGVIGILLGFVLLVIVLLVTVIFGVIVMNELVVLSTEFKINLLKEIEPIGASVIHSLKGAICCYSGICNL